ncbi:hypothetical protein yinte0001_24740 [Yersinia intermedia ATCC 29909]|nr:hypothetical protein yinte0001_24740 [Yersinia intermedia ATCC 29909]
MLITHSVLKALPSVEPLSTGKDIKINPALWPEDTTKP